MTERRAYISVVCAESLAQAESSGQGSFFLLLLMVAIPPSCLVLASMGLDQIHQLQKRVWQEDILCFVLSMSGSKEEKIWRADI